MEKLSVFDVRVGEWVGFKSDIEQVGRVVAIEGKWLRLAPPEDGFVGAYISHASETIELCEDCWKL